jgi:hypothetical protein
VADLCDIDSIKGGFSALMMPKHDFDNEVIPISAPFTVAVVAAGIPDEEISANRAYVSLHLFPTGAGRSASGNTRNGIEVYGRTYRVGVYSMEIRHTTWHCSRSAGETYADRTSHHSRARIPTSAAGLQARSGANSQPGRKRRRRARAGR